MRFRSVRRLCGVFVLMTAVAQVALAAESGSGASAPEQRLLTDKEKLDQARDRVEAIKRVAAAVQRRLSEAKSEKDVVKVNCVNDRSVRVSSLLRVAENIYADMREARARQSDGLDHGSEKIARLASQADLQRGEADQCVGLMDVANFEQVDRQLVDESGANLASDPTQPSGAAGTTAGFRLPPASPVQ